MVRCLLPVDEGGPCTSCLCHACQPGAPACGSSSSTHPVPRRPACPPTGLAATAALHSLVLEVLAFVASRYPGLYAPRRRWLITLAIAHLSATIHLLSEQLLVNATWLAYRR